MKLHRKRDLKKVGIYCITNLINNKVYIGKSINLYERLKQHITQLNTKSKEENIHLIKAWHKYGKENFEYKILEYIDNYNESFISQRELYWQIYYQCHKRKFGYNLRLDSSTKCIVSKETRERCSISGKLKYKKDPQLAINIGIKSSYFWKNNPDIKKEMAEAVSQALTKYKIYQYTKSGELVKVWNRVIDIIKENPTYKKHNIYAVCSGEKPSIYGYIWKKVKILEEIIPSQLNLF